MASDTSPSILRNSSSDPSSRRVVAVPILASASPSGTLPESRCSSERDEWASNGVRNACHTQGAAVPAAATITAAKGLRLSRNHAAVRAAPTHAVPTSIGRGLRGTEWFVEFMYPVCSVAFARRTAPAHPGVFSRSCESLNGNREMNLRRRRTADSSHSGRKSMAKAMRRSGRKRVHELRSAAALLAGTTGGPQRKARGPTISARSETLGISAGGQSGTERPTRPGPAPRGRGPVQQRLTAVTPGTSRRSETTRCN